MQSRLMRTASFFVLAACLSGAVNAGPITVFLAGDSTMAEKLPTKRPETGWGERLQRSFDSTQVRIENHAKNGRSTRTFISEGLWQEIVDHIKPGDYVFIQFGHNDESKEKVDRYTPPDDYRNNLVRMIADVRTRGGSPILLTPVMRRKFKNGVFVDTHGEYPDIVRAVAADQKVPLIDMHRRSEKVLVQMGDEQSRTLFLQLKPGENPNYPEGVEDNTHFNPTGAEVMEGLAVDGLRELKIGLSAMLLPPGDRL